MGRRSRLRLGGEPPLPAARRRALHRREKLRGNNKEAAAALSRQGRYHTISGNLRVKEVVIDDGTMRDRMVVCHNPDEALRDKALRDALIAQITDAIDGSDALSAAQRTKLHGELRAKRGLKRFVRTRGVGKKRVTNGKRAANPTSPRKRLLAAETRFRSTRGGRSPAAVIPRVSRLLTSDVAHIG